MDLLIDATGIDGAWLTRKLNVAGISHSGVTAGIGRVILHGIDPTQEQAARALVAAYDPGELVQFKARCLARLTDARITAKSIPNWATWSQQDWAAWRDANVSATQINAIGSLADAKAMLNKLAVVLDSLAQMEIALRDQIWPDLPE